MRSNFNKLERFGTLGSRIGQGSAPRSGYASLGPFNRMACTAIFLFLVVEAAGFERLVIMAESRWA